MEKLYDVDVFNVQNNRLETQRNYTVEHIKVLATLVTEGFVIILAIREVK